MFDIRNHLNLAKVRVRYFGEFWVELGYDVKKTIFCRKFSKESIST
jgi:hypothetical protein